MPQSERTRLGRSESWQGWALAMSCARQLQLFAAITTLKWRARNITTTLPYLAYTIPRICDIVEHSKYYLESFFQQPAN
ncbi:hypothetical protein BJX64DRAFT_270893 [Aspergillus heterothallicus]